MFFCYIILANRNGGTTIKRMKFVSWFSAKVQLSPCGKQNTQMKKYLFLPRHSRSSPSFMSPNKNVGNLPHAGWEFLRIPLHPSGLLNKKIRLQYFETSYPTSVPLSLSSALSLFAGGGDFHLRCNAMVSITKTHGPPHHPRASGT